MFTLFVGIAIGITKLQMGFLHDAFFLAERACFGIIFLATFWQNRIKFAVNHY